MLLFFYCRIFGLFCDGQEDTIACLNHSEKLTLGFNDIHQTIAVEQIQ